MTEKNVNQKMKLIAVQLACFLCLMFVTAGYSLYSHVKTDKLISNCFLMLLAFMVVIIHVHRDIKANCMMFDNGKHPVRLYICFLLSICIAGICCFLPVGVWPFVAIFVALTVFSNLQTGIVISILLLTLPGVLTGQLPEGYLLYLVSGIFAAILFHHIDDKFDMIQAMSLSVTGLLFCEVCCGILLTNARPTAEAFVIPVTNIIVSVLLLLGILKYFYANVLYKYRVKYLTINDTETEALQTLRNSNKELYMECVHIAHFSEIIANSLDMDKDALKTLAFYRNFSLEELIGMYGAEQIPPYAVKLLEEYHSRAAVYSRETTALIIVERFIDRAREYIKSGKKEFIIREIDNIMDSLYLEKRFRTSELSLLEFNKIRDIFKEEQLYYDFLH